MKRIPLTQGKFTLVDDKDYLELAKYKWYALKDGKTFYVRRMKRVKGVQKVVLMHAFILGKGCDHKNRNGLDNRRCNLRYATRSQQQYNRSLQSNNTSGFRGVYWDRTKGKWKSAIRIKGVLKNLGYFNLAKTAARVYDRVAQQSAKEFAVLNFPR